MQGIYQQSKRLFANRNVVIVAAKRTPIGTFCGGFANIPGPQLGVTATKAALNQIGLPATDIDEVYYGNVV